MLPLAAYNYCPAGENEIIARHLSRCEVECGLDGLAARGVAADLAFRLGIAPVKLIAFAIYFMDVVPYTVTR